MRYLAIDAGLETGYVLAQDDPLTGDVEIIEFGQAQAGFVETAQRLRDLVLYSQEPIKVIVERFDLRPNNKFLADLTTIKVNAAFEALLSETAAEVEFVEQTPSQAKRLVSNEALKRLGWYVMPRDVGRKDANDVRDAFRHLVFYLTRVVKNRRITETAFRP